MANGFVPHEPTNLPTTDAEKRDLAVRTAHLLVAQHNFLVEYMRACLRTDQTEGGLQIAKAIEDLVRDVKAIYPHGPTQLRNDIAGLGSLVGVEVLTVHIDQAKEVIH